MEEEEETPHWNNKKINLKCLSTFIGKQCFIFFKRSFKIKPGDYKSNIEGILNGYDDKFINVTLTDSIKVKKEIINKKYNCLFEIDNILSIAIEEE